MDDVRDFVETHGKTGTKDISIGEVGESRWGHKNYQALLWIIYLTLAFLLWLSNGEHSRIDNSPKNTMKLGV